MKKLVVPNTVMHTHLRGRAEHNELDKPTDYEFWMHLFLGIPDFEKGEFEEPTGDEIDKFNTFKEGGKIELDTIYWATTEEPHNNPNERRVGLALVVFKSESNEIWYEGTNQEILNRSENLFQGMQGNMLFNLWFDGKQFNYLTDTGKDAVILYNSEGIKQEKEVDKAELIIRDVIADELICIAEEWENRGV